MVQQVSNQQENNDLSESNVLSFLQAGPVTKVTICKDKDGKPKTFGFVCFKHTESVPYAIDLLNGIRLYGRPIKVQYRFGRFSYLPIILDFKNKNQSRINVMNYHGMRNV